MPKTYRVLRDRFNHDNVTYVHGDIVELTDAQAAQQIASGAVEDCDEPATVKTEPNADDLAAAKAEADAKALADAKAAAAAAKKPATKAKK